MRTPEYLSFGDKIGIVATARKINIGELQPAVDSFKNWGLEVVYGEHLFNVHHQFAGRDEQRAASLQDLLDDDSIGAIISARGGYGTLRIIDKLNFENFQKKPKWIIGYSDITVLHAHIHTNLKTETLHATMPINFAQNTQAVDSLRMALFGEKIYYNTDAHPMNRKGSCTGELIGGNLSILYALAGSKSDIKTKNKILFIEDLDEYLYHIDRMMVSLKRSGKLENLAGLVVGGMTSMKDNAVPFGKKAEEIIYDAVKYYDYPVCFNFPAGHVDKNLALYMGRKATLNVTDFVSLKFS